MTWKCLREYLAEHKTTYAEYLDTEHWKTTRKRFWESKLHNGACYSCGSKEKLQVHHKTYRRIGKERLTDLCLLCDECHGRTHELDRTRTKGCLFGAAKRLRKDIASSRGR